MALTDAMHQQESPQHPPGLRMATGSESCANCRYFQPSSVSAGACTRYGGFPVRPSQVCDSWAAKTDSGDPQRNPGDLAQQLSQPMQGGQ